MVGGLCMKGSFFWIPIDNEGLPDLKSARLVEKYYNSLVDRYKSTYEITPLEFKEANKTFLIQLSRELELTHPNKSEENNYKWLLSLINVPIAVKEITKEQSLEFIRVIVSTMSYTEKINLIKALMPTQESGTEIVVGQ